MGLHDDPLSLDRETMRRLGYQTVDMLVARISDPSIPALGRATPAEMRERLAGPEPTAPTDLEEILEQLERDVLPFMGRGDHPGYFAFVPFAATWPGALGDFVASALNVFAGSWMESAGPTQVELEVLGWFKQWIGYPASAAGSLVSGGSAANMTALACARESLVGAMSPDLVVYMSDQAHSSLARAARILGFRADQVRVLPVDETFRLDPRTVVAAIDSDPAAGRRPFFVSASAGATNTGSVDPLGELADVCNRRGIWFHADAAYGGFAVLSEEGRRSLDGLARADSVTLDPHKWLYQPYECGCLLVRDGAQLRSAFEIVPDYLRDAEAEDSAVNFSDLGMQLSRSARAFKLWLSLRYFGTDAFRVAIGRSLELAHHAADVIDASPDLEHLAPPSLGIVCFRRWFGDTSDETEIARRNAVLARLVEEQGIGLVSSTRLRGRYALRLCVMNHTSSRTDVERVLELIASADVPAGRRAPRTQMRDPGIEQGWLADSDASLAELRVVPLLAELTDPELRSIYALGVRREVPAGERIVQRWDATRDFYVVLEGSVAVEIDDELIRRLSAGEFFGELAALDWGAGFGYPRLATVVAETPVRLVVFADGSLADLVHSFPTVDAHIREAVRARLPRH